MNHETYMRMAVDHAKHALKKGEFPVGCIIVHNNTIVSTGARVNTTPGSTNEIDHAEIIALRGLSLNHPGINPAEATLYCTLEPCLMCYAAIILSGIKTIVYAYEDAMGGGTTCDLDSLPPLYKNSGMTIINGILRNQSLELFKQFFLEPDNNYWKNSYLEKYTLSAI